MYNAELVFEHPGFTRQSVQDPGHFILYIHFSSDPWWI